MTTEPKTVAALRSKVETYLRQSNQSYKEGPDGAFLIASGSTFVAILPTQWGERTVVKLTAPVALDITKVTPQLTRFLAEKNNQLLFGKFSLDTEQKAVWYEHVLLGDFLDAEELLIAVALIAHTADEHDEQVSKMARGRRPIDR